MADYDILDMAVMLRDAQRSLRKLFPDYEDKSEPCRQVLRRMMEDIPTDEQRGAAVKEYIEHRQMSEQFRELFSPYFDALNRLNILSF